MSRAAIIALATVALLLRIVPALAEKRIALVIGNGQYANANVLPNPPNDARAMGKALRDIGFEVVQGVDLDRDGMERLLREFLHKAYSAQVALLFFAGHGLQVDGRNYLVPVDAKIETASDLNFGTVDLDKILASLDDPARANIIILDACRDNPLARSFAARTRSASVGAGLAAYTALGTGTLIAFSTAPGKIAEDGRGENSPFTASLVRHLATPGIEVRQMLTRVRAEVAAATAEKQVPWDNSSLRGDVYLGGRPKTDDAKPVATAAPPADAAAQAWAATKDSVSVAVLEDFIRQFGATAYGSMARARLEELKRSRVTADVPSNRPVSPEAATQPTMLSRPPRPHSAGESCATMSSSMGIDRYCVSSVLAAQFGNSYGPHHLFSDAAGTAWVEGKPGQGIGEWIAIEFDRLRTLDGITIENGYQKNADIFYKNSRVRRLKTVFSQGDSKVFALQDRRGVQTFSLDPPIKAYWVQFVIEDVYPGNKYTDTAISKLRISSQRTQ